MGVWAEVYSQKCHFMRDQVTNQQILSIIQAGTQKSWQLYDREVEMAT